MATKGPITSPPISRLQCLLLSLWTVPSGPFLEAGKVRDLLFTQSAQSEGDELKEAHWRPG
jgi:hypothetical protein